MKNIDCQRRRVGTKNQKRRTRASRHPIVPLLEALEIRLTLSSTPVTVSINPSQYNTLYEEASLATRRGVTSPLARIGRIEERTYSDRGLIEFDLIGDTGRVDDRERDPGHDVAPDKNTSTTGQSVDLYPMTAYWTDNPNDVDDPRTKGRPATRRRRLYRERWRLHLVR